MERFTGVFIPKEILLDENLTAGEKILYANIASFDKCCFESNERLAEKCSMSERSVSRSLQKLQERGYVFAELVGGNSAKRRLYALADSPKKVKYLVAKGLLRADQSELQPVENSAEGVAKMSTQGSQNGEGGSQNGEPITDGGSPNCLPKIYKEDKSEKSRFIGDTEPVENSKPTSGSLERPLSARPKREDYDSEEEWYEASCAYMSV